MKTSKPSTCKAMLAAAVAGLCLVAWAQPARSQAARPSEYEFDTVRSDSIAIKCAEGREPFVLSYQVDTRDGVKTTSLQRTATTRMEEFPCGANCKVVVNGMRYNAKLGQRYLIRTDKTVVILDTP